MLSRSPPLRDRLWLHAALLGMLAVVIMSSLALGRWMSWQSVIEEHTRFTRNTAHALSTLIDTVLEDAEREAAWIHQLIHSSPTVLDDRAQLVELLARAQVANSTASETFIVGADGSLLASSLPRERGQASFAGTAWFKSLPSHFPGNLHLAVPSREMPDHVVLSRGIYRGDGAVLGAVVATVPVERLLLIASALRPGGPARFGIVNLDGEFLARLPRGPVVDLPPVPRPVVAHALSLGDAATIDAVSPVDRARVITSFEVSRRFGIVVISSIVPADLWRSWIAETRPLLVIDAAISALGLALTGMLLVATRRRLASERRLRESSEEIVRQSLDSMDAGFALWDADDRLLAWNQRYVEMFPPLAPRVSRGASFVDLADGQYEVARPEMTAQARRAQLREDQARRRLAPYTFELSLPGDRVVECRESPTATGGVVSVFHDVTQSRRHERELERSLAAQRELNKLQRRFVAVASHEFRTPLTVIDGAAQRVQARLDPAADDEVTKRLARIRRSVSQMTQIIDRTLSAARLDDGRIIVQREALDLVEVIDDAVDRQRLVSAGFEITIDAPVEPVKMEADPKLLDQILGNLLSNAIKYSGNARRVEVSVRSGADQVRFSVRDFGLGIPADDLPQLFNRFFRARTAMGIAGTGIGLNLVRELVTILGGSIDVASELGAGSTFTVTLPRWGATDRNGADPSSVRAAL
jgi:signal transduction histidine kinase